jgi:adenylyltransferase/sulfurtransferase
MTKYRGKQVDVVLDVRSTLERLLGKVPGSPHVPVDRLEQELPKHEGIAKKSTILVYCASGVRSANAVAVMRRMGYANAIDGGGIAAVQRELEHVGG